MAGTSESESWRGGRSLVFAAAITPLVLWLHLLAWPTIAPDMHEYVIPWYRHILEHGPVGAFAQPFSNYTPAYLYLLAAGSLIDPLLAPITVIKLIGIAGTAALAASVHALLKAMDSRWRIEAALAVFLLPTPLLNGPYLGQCDAFWTAASLMAVTAAVRGRMITMLLWCGVAISFKAQAAFLAPFVVALLIKRRAPLLHWLIPPAVYALFAAPPWLAGWPALDLLMVYVSQTLHFEFAGNLANPWSPIRHLTDSAGKGLFWIGYAAAIISVAAYVRWLSRARLDRRGIIAAALLSAFMLPWLLPKMHERYWLLADMLAFALAITARDRSSVLIAVAVNAASAISIYSFVTDWPLPVMLGALISSFALLAIVDYLVRRRCMARPQAKPAVAPPALEETVAVLRAA